MTASFSPITDRQSALDFLYGRIDYEQTRNVPYRSRRFKLDRMRKLAELIGQPHRDYPAVHIAGTKGKGSTASMVAAALTAAGLRTGLYTSPHLHRLEERFVVDGQQCNEAELVALLSDIQQAVCELDQVFSARGETPGPTYFEITTAAALLHFQRKKVDCAVLEVGLGGRLDSTNICQPAVSVVTTISFDHTRQLGKTLTKIAAEKAGIIKPGVPVVTGVCQSGPFEVIEGIAQSQDCPLIAMNRDFFFEYLGPVVQDSAQNIASDSNGLDYRELIDGTPWHLAGVEVGMLGRHQAANAAVAIATLHQLQRLGWKVDEAAIRLGLRLARCPARFEIVSRRPVVILDAAHNPASVAALSEVLDELFPGQPRSLVFATSVDKDVSRMLEQLLHGFERVALTRYLNNPRAMDPEEVARMARAMASQRGWSELQIKVLPDPASAWSYVRSKATDNHVICVAGSFFLAAEIREHLDHMS